VHAADARVDQRLDGGAGVLRRPGVVGVVDDRGDAGILGHQRGGQSAGVVVVWAVVRPVAEGGEAQVAAEIQRRGGPAQLALPGVDVRVDEAGHRDGPGGVDDDRLPGLAGEVLADLGDLAVADQDVTCRVVTHRGILAQDSGALDQDRPAATLPQLGQGTGVCAGVPARSGLGGTRRRRSVLGSHWFTPANAYILVKCWKHS
jgi:hypothetical protein